MTDWVTGFFIDLPSDSDLTHGGTNMELQSMGNFLHETTFDLLHTIIFPAPRFIWVCMNIKDRMKTSRYRDREGGRQGGRERERERLQEFDIHTFRRFPFCKPGCPPIFGETHHPLLVERPVPVAAALPAVRPAARAALPAIWASNMATPGQQWKIMGGPTINCFF